MNVDREVHEREYHESRDYGYECGLCYYEEIKVLKNKVNKLEGGKK